LKKPLKSLIFKQISEAIMSFEVFVTIVLVVIWASLPVSLIIATRDFDDAIAEDDHHH